MLEIIAISGDAFLRRTKPGERGHTSLFELRDPRGITIQAAADAGKADTFRSLLRHAGCENNEEIISRIWRAILLKENLELIQDFCEYIKANEPDKMTVLLATAVSSRKANAAQTLLELGGDANLRLLDGNQPLLHLVVRNRYHAPNQQKNLDMVKVLMQHGAQAGSVDGNAMTAAQYAVTNGHFELARVLVEHGAPLEHCWAAALGDVEYLKKRYAANPDSLWEPRMLREIHSAPAVQGFPLRSESQLAKPAARRLLLGNCGRIARNDPLAGELARPASKYQWHARPGSAATGGCRISEPGCLANVVGGRG